MRKVSLHYIEKIDCLERELKRKEIAITTYQEKLIEMNNRLAGESERNRLIERMREDILKLQQANPVSEHVSQYSIGREKIDINTPLKQPQMTKYSVSGSTLPPATRQEFTSRHFKSPIKP